MKQNFSPKRIVGLLVLAGLPMMAVAQAVVVAPPVPPAGVAAKQDVIAPAAVGDVRATALAPTGNPTAQVKSSADILDVVLPSAPVDHSAAQLTPPPPPPIKVKAQAPEASIPKPTAPLKRVASVSEPAAQAYQDPFSSVTTTPVSDSQLNRFVFPEKVEGIYFPEGAPLPTCADDAGPSDPCKPLFLNNRQMMLLQLKAGAKGPIQMLVHLHSGRVVTLNLAPGNGPGAVIRLEGAEDGASDARLASQEADKLRAPNKLQTEDERYVELVSKFAQGHIPTGFDAVKPGAPVRFSHFEVLPMASWDNGSGVKAHLMQVRAYTSQPVALSPSLFRSHTVKGVALDKESVTDKSPAQLYLVEKLAE